MFHYLYNLFIQWIKSDSREKNLTIFQIRDRLISD